MEDFPYYRSFDKLVEQCKSMGKYQIEDRVFNQSNFSLFQSYYHEHFYNIEKNGIGVNENFLKVFGNTSINRQFMIKKCIKTIISTQVHQDHQILSMD